MAINHFHSGDASLAFYAAWYKRLAGESDASRPKKTADEVAGIQPLDRSPLIAPSVYRAR